VNFDLLSQNLLLVFCGLVTTTLVFLVVQGVYPMVIPEAPKPKRGRPKKDATPLKVDARPSRVLKWKHLLALVASSLLLALAFDLLISHYTDSALPSGFIFMVLPATLSIVLLILMIIARRKLWILSAVCMVFSILFSLVLINNYYRFYPTVGAVFNKNSAIPLSDSQKEVLVQFSPQDFANTLNKQSVEGSLTSLASQPTNGKVYSLNIPGTVSHFKARTAYVYVPAIYSNPSQIDLPVIVLMPGFPGLPSNWLDSGLATTMNDFASHHDGITPIVFMVDNTGSLTNDTECVNSPRGNVETYLTVDVPNYIKAHFNVQADPSHWAIGGLSLGGTCSIMLALRHPNVYHYFIDLGGELGPEVGSQQKTIDELFGGSYGNWEEHQPSYLLATRTYKNMGGFFGVGKQDELNVTQAAAQLSSETQKAGIETIYETINGQHTFNVWQETFKLALPWVSNRIGATECASSCL
jgi:enterochelin esterase-like enzyme